MNQPVHGSPENSLAVELDVDVRVTSLKLTLPVEATVSSTFREPSGATPRQRPTSLAGGGVGLETQPPMAVFVHGGTVNE